MLFSTALQLLASTLFAAFCGLAPLPLWTRPDNGFMGWPPLPWDATYDYVVMGGGTAGITVASRLAQEGFHVALVEAGGYYELMHPLSKIPGAATIGIGASISTASSVDWKFVAQKVPGANYRDIHYPRGKCLGGSSALNFMIYQRSVTYLMRGPADSDPFHSPSKGAMDRWAELVDDPSYTFKNTWRYFKQTVSFTAPDSRSDNIRTPYNESAFDDFGEPLQVSYPRYAMPFSSWLRWALTAIGIQEIKDFNSGSLMGHQFCSMTIRPTDESRSSSEAAFLQSPQNLETLSIYEKTLAKKILFDWGNRARGVRVHGMWDYTLWARREVILSAGAFHSPQLLMLSGIGPARVLWEHGIKPIVTLPGVGQNMWDHVFFGPSYRVAVDTFSRMAQNPVWLAGQVSTYLFSHNGMLTNPSTDYLAFEKLPSASRYALTDQDEGTLSWFPEDWPEIEYLAASAFVGNFSDPFFQQPHHGQYASIIASIVAPTSRGNVTLRSGNAADLPVINPNWLDTEIDQKLAVAAYKRIRDMFRTPAMKPILIGPEYFPGLEYQSDEEILDVIKNTLMTIYHASCTCKMGTRNDSMAVVDHRARVFGVTGLRVVDASAFPFLPPGHPQSVVYMLAEKIAADIIGS